MFSLLRAFDEGIAWNDLRLNLLGITSQGGVVPPGLSMLHFVAWKFIILALTLKGVENRPYDPHTTLESIRNWMVSRTRSIEHATTIAIHQAEARGMKPSFGTTRKWLKGIADVNNAGTITYRVEFRQWLYPPRPNREAGLSITRRRLDGTDS